MSCPTAERWKNRIGRSRTYGPTESKRIGIPVLTEAGPAEVQVPVKRRDRRVFVELNEGGVYAEGEKVADWCELEEQARERKYLLLESKIERARERAEKRREEIVTLENLSLVLDGEQPVLDRIAERLKEEAESAEERVEHLKEVCERGKQLGLGSQ